MTKTQKHLYRDCRDDLELLRQDLAIWRKGKTGRTNRMPAEVVAQIRKIGGVIPANILKREIGVDGRSIRRIVNGIKRPAVSNRQVPKQQALVDVTKYIEARATENVANVNVQIELIRPNGCRLVVNSSSALVSAIVNQFMSGVALC